MKLHQVIENIKGARVVGESNIDVRDVVSHSRHVTPGALFVALAGNRDDGHRYQEEAVRRGAKALMSEEHFSLPPGITHVVVPDARRGLAQAAAAFMQHPSRELVLVGVTGTNGKTTVSFLLESIFQAQGQHTGLLGTIAYRYPGFHEEAKLTTPSADDFQRLLRRMCDAGTRACVMEVSSHALLQQRVASTTFAAAVFTNLTPEHLDYHETMENYYQAKEKLFLPDDTNTHPGKAVINIDDSFGARLAEKCRGWCTTYGASGSADVCLQQVESTSAGITLTAKISTKSITVTSPLVGRFHLQNLLAAIATATALDVQHDAIIEGIRRVSLVPGRFEKISEKNGVTVIVDYAHTPDALERSLAAARDGAKGRVILVFGCGGDRDRSKRQPMGDIAGHNADVVIITSDNPRSENPESIIDDIVCGVKVHQGAWRVLPDRRAAIFSGLEEAAPGDVVLIAGKGHETYQIIGHEKIPFDDRSIVKEWYASPHH